MEFDAGFEIAAEHRAALNVVGQGVRADDVEAVTFRVTLEDGADGLVELGADEAGDAVIAAGAVAGLVEDLAVVVVDHPPAICAGARVVEVRIEAQSAR